MVGLFSKEKGMTGKIDLCVSEINTDDLQSIALNVMMFHMFL